MPVPSATQLSIARDVNGYPIQTSDIGLPFTNLTQSFLLVQNTYSNIFVPEGNAEKMLVLIEYTPFIDVWVTGDGTVPVIPTTTLLVSTQQLNPHARLVHAGDNLRFLTGSGSSVWVNLSYYQVLNP